MSQHSGELTSESATFCWQPYVSTNTEGLSALKAADPCACSSREKSRAAPLGSTLSRSKPDGTQSLSLDIQSTSIATADETCGF